MFPTICAHFIEHQDDCVSLLRAAAAIPGVRHVRVASGVRFDLALKNRTALEAYAGEFTGGQLKIAPEHCAASVLKLMRKPGLAPFEAFLSAFASYSRAHGKEQYVIPYLMSAFPGCTDEHMRELGRWLSARHWSPKQVQCFIPTPGTVATAMFYAGVDTHGAPIFVARTDAERRRQHAILLGECSSSEAMHATTTTAVHRKNSIKNKRSYQIRTQDETRTGHKNNSRQPVPFPHLKNNRSSASEPGSATRPPRRKSGHSGNTGT